MNININNLKQVNEFLVLMQDAEAKRAFLDSVIVEKEESFKRSAEADEKAAIADAKAQEAASQVAKADEKAAKLAEKEAELDIVEAELDAAAKKLTAAKITLAQGTAKLEEEIQAHHAAVASKEAKLAAKLKECEDIKSETLALKEALEAKLEKLRKTIEG